MKCYTWPLKIVCFTVFGRSSKFCSFRMCKQKWRLGYHRTTKCKALQCTYNVQALLMLCAVHRHACKLLSVWFWTFGYLNNFQLSKNTVHDGCSLTWFLTHNQTKCAAKNVWLSVSGTSANPAHCKFWHLQCITDQMYWATECNASPLQRNYFLVWNRYSFSMFSLSFSL